MQVLQKIAFILACLVLPIVWGVLVNWVFNLWQSRKAARNNGKEDEWIFPDYQI